MLRFQVGMNSLSVPKGTYQAGTQTPFFPWRSRDRTSFLFLPAAPVAAAICHRAEPLPSVHSNSFAAERIWHSHKGPLSVPEVEHTMQSFPLVTELGFRSWVRDAVPMTAAHKHKLTPSPAWEPSSHIKGCRSVETGEQSRLSGAFNSGDLYSDLLKGRAWVSTRALPSVFLHNFFHLGTTRPPECKGLQIPVIFLSSRGQKLGRLISSTNMWFLCFFCHFCLCLIC